MGIKISELPAATALAGTEPLPIVQDGQTRQTTVASLIAAGTITHHQLIPAAAWVITHNLNRTPSVTVIDSAETVVYGDIQHHSSNQLTLSFTAAFAGTAYLV